MDSMQIRVSTEVLEMRANAAEEKINDVRKRFGRIAEIVHSSSGYWEGEANDAHRREYQEYQSEIEEALARFQENVTDLRKIAGIYRETEADTTSFSGDLPMDVII
ncbi:WXG100 family type VII secretion target [Frisingicoccus sp.]|uniref:WXG100 family type VII secretion target n=1 Tax=Frisingicoccus sp. TaxID=1918627 RepID=UPI003AB5792B